MKSTAPINERHAIWHDVYPRSNAYDPDWVIANEMGPNALWLTEWLCRAMDLQAGMRVLDMGCGRALSSVFLAREFGVRVWANDLWIAAAANWERICAAGLRDQICPIHAEAHALPYAEGFFDAIVSIDSYQYYGTDDLYLGYFSKYVAPGGQIGIVVPGLMRPFEGPPPEHLTRPQANGSAFWAEDCWSIHTRDYWHNLWSRSSLVDVELAETMPDGWRLWLRWEQAHDASGQWRRPSEAGVLADDQGRYLGFVRMVARRRKNA